MFPDTIPFAQIEYYAIWRSILCSVLTEQELSTAIHEFNRNALGSRYWKHGPGCARALIEIDGDRRVVLFEAPPEKIKIAKGVRILKYSGQDSLVRMLGGKPKGVSSITSRERVVSVGGECQIPLFSPGAHCVGRLSDDSQSR